MPKGRSARAKRSEVRASQCAWRTSAVLAALACLLQPTVGGASETVVTAPVVTASVVTAPVVTASVVSTPVVTAPVVSTPVVTAPVAPYGPTTHPGDASTSTLQGCVDEAGKFPLQIALRHYVKQAKPKPMRFLMAAGTDSAISDAGARVLQEFGPSYYYAGNEAAKQKMREKLELVGPYPALLVVVRGTRKVGSKTEIIRLGGHYVTGEHDGKTAASTVYTIVCGAAGWALQSAKEEKAS